MARCYPSKCQGADNACHRVISERRDEIQDMESDDNLVVPRAQAYLGPPSTMMNGSMRQVFKVSPLDILNRRHLERADARTQLLNTLFQLV